MNRSMIAGLALLCGITAAPTVAGAADEPARTGPSAPAEAVIPMEPGAGSGMSEHGGGMMGGHPGMGHMMHHRMSMSPQQRCEERLARSAGRIAYTVTKLKLTAEQRPLWDNVNAMLQGAREREQQLCATLQGGAAQGGTTQGGTTTMLDRLNRREQFLTAHLQAVQQVKPALEQLYRVLTPEQKAIMDNPSRRG